MYSLGINSDDMDINNNVKDKHFKTSCIKILRGEETIKLVPFPKNNLTILNIKTKQVHT